MMQRARIRVQWRSENAQAHKRRAEYCELLFDRTGLWVSQSTMCRTFQRLGLPLKKKRSAPVKLRVNGFNSLEPTTGNK